MNEDQTGKNEQQPEPDQEPEAVEQDERDRRIAELEDKYRRAVADLANAHRRFRTQSEQTGKMAIASFVKKLLPVIDNMSHSLRAAETSHDAAALIEGFKLLETQLLQIFGENGIKPIEAEGRPFDPEVHHAVMPEPTDKVPPGTVTEETGRGFIMDDFVIRPAQVKVAAPPTDHENDKQVNEEET